MGIIDNIKLNQRHQNIKKLMRYTRQNTNESLIAINTTERTKNDIVISHPVF